MGIKTQKLIGTRRLKLSEKPPHHMGIKTCHCSQCDPGFPLKNLPTTWGLRPNNALLDFYNFPLKNLPTTWGLRL